MGEVIVSTLKTAKTWSEEVWFAECPKCECSIDLGSGVSWHTNAESSCPECGEVFLLEAQNK